MFAKHQIAGVSMVALGWALATPVMAQESAGSDTVNNRDDVIIVTAQKREEQLIDVPISLAALGEEQLEQQQISELRDFVGQVPNLLINNFNARSNTVRMFIRGIGQNDVSLTQDPSVALYVDGIYVGTSIGGGFETDDIARIEVLRGPQGTLYGRNATGGAINVISNKPDTSGPAAKASFTAGNYDLRRANAMVNIPLSDSLAIRGTIVKADRGGLQKNLGLGRDAAEQDRLAARASVRFQPSDRITIDYAYDYSLTKDSGTLSVPIEGSPATYPIGAPFALPGTGGLAMATSFIVNEFTNPSPFTAGRPKEFTSVRAFSDGRGKVQGHTASIDWDAADALTLRALVGRRTINNQQLGDQVPTANTFIRTIVTESVIPTLPVGAVVNEIGPNSPSATDDTLDFEATSAELQAFGTIPFSSGSMDYVAGLYYYEDDAELQTMSSPVGSGPQTFTDYTTIANTSKAAFAQVTVRPFEDEKLSITVGARYSDDEREATRINERSISFAALGGYTAASCAYFEARRVFAPGACDPSGVTQAANYNRKFSNFSLSGTLAYKLNDDFNIYARYAEGYKSGGTSQRSSNPINFAEGFEPEEITSYEMGIKANLFDRRVNASIAGFFMQLDSLQSSVVSGATPGDRDFIGIDGSEIYGVEFDISARLTDWLRAGISGGLLHTSIGVKQAEVLRDTGETSIEIFSDKLQFAPESSGSAYVEVATPINDDWDISAYTSVTYQGPTNTALNAIDDRILQTRGIVDANIGLTRNYGDGREITFRLWAKNLLDREYDVMSFGAFAFSGAQTLTEYGEPRTYGLTLIGKY
ncbi:MAG: TonB-dependent receptor [Sphingomonadaceae bacterium]|nr:TonB-dependent receptor [Sphingomonadaceae bacterium]